MALVTLCVLSLSWIAPFPCADGAAALSRALVPLLRPAGVMNMYNPYLGLYFEPQPWHPARRVTGRNVLRKLHGLEVLTRLALAARRYSFFLQTSDNDHWLGPLDLPWFEARLAAMLAACRAKMFWERIQCHQRAANGTAFSKNCNTHGAGQDREATRDPLAPPAVNDKTLLLTAAVSRGGGLATRVSHWGPADTPTAPPSWPAGRAPLGVPFLLRVLGRRPPDVAQPRADPRIHLSAPEDPV